MEEWCRKTPSCCIYLPCYNHRLVPPMPERKPVTRQALMRLQAEGVASMARKEGVWA